MASDLPTGTLTFLFTDIEGSTACWEQQRDAMSAALVRHDARAADRDNGPPADRGNNHGCRVCAPLPP